MSAIYGIVNHDGRPVDPSALARMSESMAHREADDLGVWIKDSVGIGHRMMRTTPESLHEKLPFWDKESELVITADARIDNRVELGEALGLIREVNDGTPDSTLILCAYKKWRESCVDHLLGDFAFVIRDERRKLFFCARDHMGIRPFNYFADHNRFVFATEAPAILKAPGVPNKINEERIADFLVEPLEGIDKTSTFYRDIYRLPPAHTLVITGKKIIKNCYWTPDPDKKIVLNSDEEYVDAFNEIYTDAIDKRLRSNNDVASMLSGGNDSSSIVGIARELHLARTGKPFPVFTAVSADDPDCRETHYINVMLDQGGLSATTISPDELDSYAEEIGDIVERALEPFDPMIMIIAIYLLAKNSGYRVMLDGLDGDMIHSLSPAYPAILIKNGKYRQAIDEMRLQKKNLYGDEISFARILYHILRAAYSPPFQQKIRRTLSIRKLRKSFNHNIINKDFARKIHLTDRIARLYEHGCNGLCQSFGAMHTAAILHPYVTVGVERYDRIAALCGIEHRHPLLDRRLIDFMLAIPWNQKVRSGWNKYLLRSASEAVVPGEICWQQGGGHVGHKFERKWQQMYFNEVTTTLEEVPHDSRKYFDLSRMKSIFDLTNTKSDNHKGFYTTRTDIHYLLNWLSNSEH